MVRAFRQQDMEHVIAIWFEASIQAHAFMPRDFWEAKAADMRSLYIPNSETYVYEDDGVVKGFIALHENTVAALFVSPDSQHAGIGSQLIAQAKSSAASLRLTVYKENPIALRFYRKQGFTVAHERVDEHTGHQELLMVFP